MSLGNCVNLIGRLTADPEIRTVVGIKVCNFTLARNGRPKSGEETESYFFDCVAWRGTAELLEKHFKRGSRLGVSGELRTRTFKDNSGNNRKVTEVLVNSIEFIDPPASSNKPNSTNTSYTDISNEKKDTNNTTNANTANNDVGEGADDELPF